MTLTHPHRQPPRALRAGRTTRLSDIPAFWLASFVLAGAALAGGSAVRAQAVQDPSLARAAASAVPLPDYRIGRGDELQLRFFYTPELNTVAVVRSDGRISVPLIGELAVEGLTVRELSGVVEQRLSAQVNRPQVSINVQGAATQRVFVGGEVVKSGMQPLAGPLTVLQAVMVAEGLKDTALPSRVVLLRRDAKGHRQVLPVDLEAVMAGQPDAPDPGLQPFDVILVPRSGIADVGRWVDLYVRRVLPFSMGFSYAVDRNGVIR